MLKEAGIAAGTVMGGMGGFALGGPLGAKFGAETAGAITGVIVLGFAGGAATSYYAAAIEQSAKKEANSIIEHANTRIQFAELITKEAVEKNREKIAQARATAEEKAEIYIAVADEKLKKANEKIEWLESKIDIDACEQLKKAEFKITKLKNENIDLKDKISNMANSIEEVQRENKADIEALRIELMQQMYSFIHNNVQSSESINRESRILSLQQEPSRVEERLFFRSTPPAPAIALLEIEPNSGNMERALLRR